MTATKYFNNKSASIEPQQQVMLQINGSHFNKDLTNSMIVRNAKFGDSNYDLFKLDGDLNEDGLFSSPNNTIDRRESIEGDLTKDILATPNDDIKGTLKLDPEGAIQSFGHVMDHAIGEKVHIEVNGAMTDEEPTKRAAETIFQSEDQMTNSNSLVPK